MKLPTTPQVSYLAALPIIQRVAKEHGYTIAVHGSLARDLDVIAVPWLEEAAEPHVLVLALIHALEGFVSPEDPEVPLRLPHGRLCYPIHLGSGRYVDLSVTPGTCRVAGTVAPKPLAWIRRHPDGAFTGELLLDEQIEQVRKDSGSWVPLGRIDGVEVRDGQS